MQLVGVPSGQDAGVQRVNAGNPDLSYLIQKLEGTAAAGGQMPPGAPLAQASIDVIRLWISQGAIDDRVAATTPIRVTSILPAPGAMIASTPAQILVGFDRQPDASTVNANTFMLEASGGDGTFGDGNEMSIAAAVPPSVAAANPMSAVFDLTGVLLADDTYQVRLLGNGASVIMDTDANALDGELVAALPSGNGIAGGDFETTFTLATPSAFERIQTEVFEPSCATVGCHSAATAAEGLDMSTADSSYAEMVDVLAVQQVIDLVEPGDPDNSYLIQKMENAPTISGVVMPPAGVLPQATIDEIRLWIANGAER